MPDVLEPELVGLIDDAAIFPPGDADLHEASAAHVARRAEPWADLVGTFVVRDTDVPLLRGSPARLSVVVTGGAGQVAGPAGLCAKLGLELAGLEIALRDLDDLAGNARRVATAVDAARADGTLADDVPVYVELPHVGSTASWLAAADEVAARRAAAEVPHRRAGGRRLPRRPRAGRAGSTRRSTARRRSSARPGCTAPSGTPSDEGFEQHGFLNVMVATQRAFDGAGLDEVVATLEERDGTLLAAADRPSGRRWFTSFGSCSVDEPLADLRDLGLVAR